MKAIDFVPYVILGLALILWGAGVATMLYVAYHFVSKFW